MILKERFRAESRRCFINTNCRIEDSRDLEKRGRRKGLILVNGSGHDDDDDDDSSDDYYYDIYDDLLSSFGGETSGLSAFLTAR
jgi:hypothetical protein